MRITVTIDADLDVDTDLSRLKQLADGAGVSLERYLEDEPSVWWHALENSDPTITVYVDDEF